MRFPPVNPSEVDKALDVLRRMIGRGCRFELASDGRTILYEVYAGVSNEPLSVAELDELVAHKPGLIEALKPHPASRLFPVRPRLAAHTVAEAPTEPEPVPV